MDVDSVRPFLMSNPNSATNAAQLESFQVSASEQNAVDSLNATLFKVYLRVVDLHADSTEAMQSSSG